MAAPSHPPRAVGFAAVMFRTEEDYRRARAALEERQGEVYLESRVFPFDFTDYYREEMGGGLSKRFLAFSEPVERACLVEMKTVTGGIERELSVGGRRRVNLDPGYVTPHSVVLATAKDFPHRVYLGRGVFAEVTMTFRRSGPEFFPWTYADYRTDVAREFFTELRARAVGLQRS
ncbi:MAG: DUF4416 family protein [Euryarchaeota archaeon]|nr:DUF4416 family protein [Euryarchaeota archaeon]